MSARTARSTAPAPVPFADRALVVAALVLGVLPLWAAHHLPMVDLPQHLHLISALHRLEDPSTLYPQLFAARHELTPYLGYYYSVSLLHWLVPLDVANRLFLSAYVAGLPLALAFLLRGLGRPTWPALLSLPLAYGDNFGWGFINYLAALPLALLCCGLFVRALTRAGRRRAWAMGLAACLVAVLLFHVQVFAFLALALPWLLLTTPVERPPERPDAGDRAGPFVRWLLALLRTRGPALLGVLPGVLLFLSWVVLRLGQPSQVEAGAPWKAWGPMLSARNLAWKSDAQNLAELFEVLANLLRDGSDRFPLYAVGAVGAVALGLGLAFPARSPEPSLGRVRLPGLVLIALGLYFLLPFDIRGYTYYLNTRYAQLAALLALASVPVTRPGFQRGLLLASAACAGVLAGVLVPGFQAFSREAREWDELARAVAPRPRVMGLIFDAGSRAVRHPVFLHGAAELARAGGGGTNFSFALTPHSPLRYRGEPPPTFPSEWRPQDFDWATQGAAYDHFLVRGAPPSRVFGTRLQHELGVVAQSGDSWLVRRR